MSGPHRSTSMIVLTTSSASDPMNLRMLMAPSSNLGIADCSRVLSARLSIAVFVLSFESVMSQFQILGRRLFPFKATSICFAYTNLSDTIAHEEAQRSVRG